MEKLIGSKDYFAIEYRISDKENLMGYARIWLNGSFIGSIKDLIYFESYLYNLLYQFVNSNTLNEFFKEFSGRNLFDLLKIYTYDDDKYNASQYECLGATFTDDFYIFSFLKDNNINIIWKVRNNPFFEDSKILGEKVYVFEMEKEFFCRLTEEYINSISSALSL